MLPVSELILNSPLKFHKVKYQLFNSSCITMTMNKASLIYEGSETTLSLIYRNVSFSSPLFLPEVPLKFLLFTSKRNGKGKTQGMGFTNSHTWVF